MEDINKEVNVKQNKSIKKEWTQEERQTGNNESNKEVKNEVLRIGDR